MPNILLSSAPPVHPSFAPIGTFSSPLICSAGSALFWVIGCSRISSAGKKGARGSFTPALRGCLGSRSFIGADCSVSGQSATALWSLDLRNVLVSGSAGGKTNPGCYRPPEAPAPRPAASGRIHGPPFWRSPLISKKRPEAFSLRLEAQWLSFFYRPHCSGVRPSRATGLW